MIISFGKASKEWVIYLHDDTLVVTMLVANFTTRMILIDNSSSVDIFLCDAFTQMGIDPAYLRPVPILLKGFTGEYGSISRNDHPFNLGQQSPSHSHHHG